jgi:hypothetical protein
MISFMLYRHQLDGEMTDENDIHKHTINESTVEDSTVLLFKLAETVVQVKNRLQCKTIQGAE